MLLCPVPSAGADHGLCAPHGAAGSALDEPGTALVDIGVLGHTLLCCVSGHTWAGLPQKGTGLSYLWLLGWHLDSQEFMCVCACVSKACRAAC